ncbi:sugar diacid recognition domain-containing protein [Chryseomicrobium sp. FSL W7-1435]|uniref:CdaR family transcriptional regulator n=1 Tax=Chryseomicrobium sp. FSL W7-1435 TaxID=2921704 RepID=UPI00315AE84E
MFDLSVVGHDIVHELSELMEQHVVVTDRSGFVIASTNPERINTFHEGAAIAMRQKEQFYITEQLSKELKGVRPGIVMPILIMNEAIGVIGITGLPETIERYAKLVRKVVELFVTDFLSRQEKERTTREIEYFIADYLLGEYTVTEALQRARILDFPLNKFYQVAILQGTSFLGQETVDRILSMQTLHPELAIVRSGMGQLILFLPKIDKTKLLEGLQQIQSKLMKQLGDYQPIGIGRCGDLRESYQQAKTAVKISDRQQRVVFEENLKLELLYYQLPEDGIQTFLERTISPICKDHELMETLQAYFETNGSLQDVADELFVHKNTLKYRLAKIENLLGIHFSNRADLAEVYTAYRLYARK